MTPRGLIAYIAGVLFLVGGMGLALLSLLYAASDLHRRLRPEVGLLFIISGLLVFTAVHLLAAGLYRMLVHFYHTVSRTDPAGDRRLRGRTIFLLGQLSSTMTVPMTVLFLALAASEAGRPDNEVGMVLLGVLPFGFGLILSLTAWCAGLAIMVRDLFLRHRDIVEKREAERRRRLEEANEPQTEVIPPDHLTTQDLRAHIKEDR
jgi:hypothetical protein